MRKRKFRPFVGLTTLGWLCVIVSLILGALIVLAAMKGYY